MRVLLAGIAQLILMKHAPGTYKRYRIRLLLLNRCLRLLMTGAAALRSTPQMVHAVSGSLTAQSMGEKAILADAAGSALARYKLARAILGPAIVYMVRSGSTRNAHHTHRSQCLCCCWMCSCHHHLLLLLRLPLL